MDAVIKFRTELNLNEKENGVKISVNDIIVKAMALALRDYPVVNSQWHLDQKIPDSIRPAGGRRAGGPHARRLRCLEERRPPDRGEGA